MWVSRKRITELEEQIAELTERVRVVVDRTEVVRFPDDVILPMFRSVERDPVRVGVSTVVGLLLDHLGLSIKRNRARGESYEIEKKPGSGVVEMDELSPLAPHIAISKKHARDRIMRVAATISPPGKDQFFDKALAEILGIPTPPKKKPTRKPKKK